MEFNENKPIYLQLADRIMDEVEQQLVSGGERIQSVREFAARMGVNSNTVMRTYSWLQQEGIIYNQRGIGYFLSEDAAQKVHDMRRRAFLNHEMDYFMERLRIMGITPEEFSAQYRRYLESWKNK